MCNSNNLCAIIRQYIYGSFQKKKLFPFIKGFSLIYLKFIDDIFFYMGTDNKKDLMKIFK